MPASLSLVLCLASGAIAQNTTVHTSGGDGISWALARVGAGQTANIGEIGGVKIGELRHDEFIVVRAGKSYYSTDEKLMKDVEAARGPLDSLRVERDGIREKARALRNHQRDLQREARSLQVQERNLERKIDRSDESQREQLKKEILGLSQKAATLGSQASDLNEKLAAANANVEAANKKREAARAVIERKVEAIIENAFRNNLLHPF